MFQRRFKARRNGNSVSTGNKEGFHYDNGDGLNSYGGVGGGNGGSLANFDACIEACDAFAASSGRMGFQQQQEQKQQQQQQGGKDQVQYADKSIMISPDGELLSSVFIGLGGHIHRGSSPNDSSISENNNTNKTNTAPSNVDGDKNDIINESETTLHLNLVDGNNENNNENQSTSNDDTSVGTNQHDHYHDKHQHQYQSTSPSSKNEDFESSIYIGHDAVPDGEKVMNGFSARGWNPVMMTMAIRRAVDTLQTTGKFVEELILTRKNSAANASQACEQLRDMMIFEGLDTSIASNDSHNQTNGRRGSPGKNKNKSRSENPPALNNEDNNNSDNSNSNEENISSGQRSDAGPLLFPGGSLYDALVAMEQYNSNTAEGDAHRWRMASSTPRSSTVTGTSETSTGGVLTAIQTGTRNNYIRAERRERALMDTQQFLAEAESNLRARKDESRKLWNKFNKVEDEINQKVEEKLRQRSRAREMKRRQDENERQAAVSDGKLQSTVTQQEIWELVAQVGADYDGSFAPHDLPPPNVNGPIDQTLSQSKSFDSPEKTSEGKDLPPLSPIDNYRAELEEEYRLHDLHVAAVESDENVSDAAGKLLNAISASDTTKRSSRIAAETCLLSCANAQKKCLKSLVALERASLNERLKMINELEEKVDAIDVRSDLNLFIEHEKSEIPSGATRMGSNDDGGVASALATLNSFSEGIGVGVGVAGMAELSSFTGWNDDQEEEVVDRSDLEGAVSILFKGTIYKDDSIDIAEKEKNFKQLEESVTFLQKAVSEKTIRGRGYRASTCYALNNHRGKNTQLYCEEQYDGLCRVLNSLLDGCDREAADVANAKMCMMLAQTFYYNGSSENIDGNKDRTKRMYPKEKLCHHSIWLDEDFWTQALFQCVTDSLANSGVMIRVRVKKSERNRKMKWHDLNHSDRADAASQIHAVIFSQLGALAHSMVEFGCSVEQACAFVRRLSVRHQLPLSQRSMLLSHLMNGNQESAPTNYDHEQRSEI